MKGSQNEMFTFSVVDAAPLEVVVVLCQYLEQQGCAELPPIGNLDNSIGWQQTTTIFIESVLLRIEVSVKSKGDDVIIHVNDLLLNDVIRCRRMLNSLLEFVRGSGLNATCNHCLSYSFRLLDDDFDTSDYDVNIGNGLSPWIGKVDIKSVDIDEHKCDLLEQTLQTIACLATSNMESHQALAKGLVESRASISSLLHMASFVETYPSWLRHCETW